MSAGSLRKGISFLPTTACCWRGYPPCVAHTLAALLQGSSARAILQPLSGHQCLQGCCATSDGHPDYTASDAQWGSQSHSMGMHEKSQAWASSYSHPLTAVEPQTKTSADWVSDNVLHSRLYSVIFMCGKELEGEILVPCQELLMPSFMKWERHVWAIPKHKLDGYLRGLPAWRGAISYFAVHFQGGPPAFPWYSSQVGMGHEGKGSNCASSKQWAFPSSEEGATDTWHVQKSCQVIVCRGVELRLMSSACF